jgi:hypothetical protein
MPFSGHGPPGVDGEPGWMAIVAISCGGSSISGTANSNGSTPLLACCRNQAGSDCNPSSGMREGPGKFEWLRRTLG